MKKKSTYKQNKGNKYAHNSEFAEEVIAKNDGNNPYPVQQELAIKNR